MKTVFSSTIEQEQEIENLVTYFYKTVFPQFFTKNEILHFMQIGVLHKDSGRYAYHGTLKSAFQIMSCLQVILTLLDKKITCTSFQLDTDSEDLLNHNIRLLSENGLFFPFTHENFNLLVGTDDERFSYVEPANQFLI